MSDSTVHPLPWLLPLIPKGRRCSARKRCRPAVNLNMNNWRAKTLPKCRGKGGYAVILGLTRNPRWIWCYTLTPKDHQLTAGVYYSIATWLRLLFMYCSGYEIFHKLAYVACTIIGQNSSTYTVSQGTFQKNTSKNLIVLVYCIENENCLKLGYCS